jgi:hypothetical protein
MLTQFEFTDAQLDSAYELLMTATEKHPLMSKHLNRLFDEPDMNGYPRNRALIRAVIFSRKLPMGADARGYYVIKTQAEMDAYEKSIESRVIGMRARLSAVRKAFREMQEREKHD